MVTTGCAARCGAVRCCGAVPCGAARCGAVQDEKEDAKVRRSSLGEKFSKQVTRPRHTAPAIVRARPLCERRGHCASDDALHHRGPHGVTAHVRMFVRLFASVPMPMPMPYAYMAACGARCAIRVHTLYIHACLCVWCVWCILCCVSV